MTSVAAVARPNLTARATEKLRRRTCRVALQKIAGNRETRRSRRDVRDTRAAKTALVIENSKQNQKKYFANSYLTRVKNYE